MLELFLSAVQAYFLMRKIFILVILAENLIVHMSNIFCDK